MRTTTSFVVYFTTLALALGAIAGSARASSITFSGFTNDSDVALFEISGSSGTFTATTSGYAQGGFSPLMCLFDPLNGWWPTYTGTRQIADQRLTFVVDRTFLLMLSVANNEPSQNLANIVWYQTDPKFTDTMYGCTGQFCTRDHQSRSGAWVITFSGDPGLTLREIGSCLEHPERCKATTTSWNITRMACLSYQRVWIEEPASNKRCWLSQQSICRSWAFYSPASPGWCWPTSRSIIRSVKNR